MGKSWMNTVAGIVVLLGNLANFIDAAVQQNGMPATVHEWLIFLIGNAGGIGLILSKQFNVSNSERPAAAVRVTPAMAAKPNPAAPAPVIAHTGGPGGVSAILLLLGVGLLLGCNAAQVTKANDVVLQLQTNTQQVLVYGCANAPTVQVLVATILEFLPEGTDKEKLVRGVIVANANIAALCAKVQTPEALAVPVP